MNDLGTLGGRNSAANGVAADMASGVPVVGTAEMASESAHAFVLTGKGLHDLGTLGGATSFANGINATGMIMGGAQTAAGTTRAAVAIATAAGDLVCL